MSDFIYETVTATEGCCSSVGVTILIAWITKEADLSLVYFLRSLLL